MCLLITKNQIMAHHILSGAYLALECVELSFPQSVACWRFVRNLLLPLSTKRTTCDPSCSGGAGCVQPVGEFSCRSRFADGYVSTQWSTTPHNCPFTQLSGGCPAHEMRQSCCQYNCPCWGGRTARTLRHLSKIVNKFVRMFICTDS